MRKLTPAFAILILLGAGCGSSNTDQNSSSAPSSSTRAPSSNREYCVIKGNISQSTGERIYHLPGRASYSKTVIDESAGEQWFCSEADARGAGWRKAKNC